MGERTAKVINPLASHISDAMTCGRVWNLWTHSIFEAEPALVHHFALQDQLVLSLHGAVRPEVPIPIRHVFT